MNDEHKLTGAYYPESEYEKHEGKIPPNASCLSKPALKEGATVLGVQLIANAFRNTRTGDIRYALTGNEIAAECMANQHEDVCIYTPLELADLIQTAIVKALDKYREDCGKMAKKAYEDALIKTGYKQPPCDNAHVKEGCEQFKD